MHINIFSALIPSSTTSPLFFCKPDQVLCYYNRCIPSLLRCDRVYQCSDGSDESGCSTTTITSWTRTTATLGPQGTILQFFTLAYAANATKKFNE